MNLALTYRILVSRCGFIVRGEFVLELKSPEQLGSLHEAQLLTYLRLSGCNVGLPINSNTVPLTDGIRRRVL
jgi:GxxExxY protein